MTTYGPRYAPPILVHDLVDDLSRACLRASRAQDQRTFACARPAGHAGDCYGRDRSGPVRLGYGPSAF